jgi:hypothetical protein
MYTKEPIQKVDPSGISVIDNNGEIQWISTPFNALCNCDIGLLNANTSFTVFEVGKTKKNELVFIIGDYYYHFSYFTISDI